MKSKTEFALNKFSNLLESKYDILIEDSTYEHLNFICEYYSNKKNEYDSNDIRYKKAFLISEVARLMILREIQPKPLGKRKRGK
jgi:hypothetical protein